MGAKFHHPDGSSLGILSASYWVGNVLGVCFLLGIGGVVVGAVGPVLMAELAYPNHRATATAMSNTQY